MTFDELLSALGLEGQPRRVLIVEDAVSFASRLESALQQRGHDVTALVGINDCEDGLAHGLNLLEQPSAVKLAEFDAAFLDYYFASDRYNGLTVVNWLSLVGRARICGMSSDRGANERMRDAGSHITLQKARLRTLVSEALGSSALRNEP